MILSRWQTGEKDSKRIISGVRLPTEWQLTGQSRQVEAPLASPLAAPMTMKFSIYLLCAIVALDFVIQQAGSNFMLLDLRAPVLFRK
jgi:hypothetical protein